MATSAGGRLPCKTEDGERGRSSPDPNRNRSRCAANAGRATTSTMESLKTNK